MKSLKIILSVILLTVSFHSSKAEKYPRFIQKKIDKTLKKTFGERPFTFEAIEVPEIHTDEIKDIRIETILLGKEKLGYLAFASSFAKDDYFDYMIVFDPDQYIKKVVVLAYRSTYGSEIMAKYWLRQFEGKRNGEEMIFEKDIDAISGATLSAPAIVEGVKWVSELLFKLQK